MKIYNKILLSIITLSVIMVGCGTSNSQHTEGELKQNESVTKYIKEIEDSFQKLKEYNSLVHIEELWIQTSHADDQKSFSGILEQTKIIADITPQKGESEFKISNNMYNIIDNTIMDNESASSEEATYQNILKDRIKEKDPYHFKIQGNIATKVKGTPSFYCEGCVGSYLGKTKYDTEHQISDSFQEDEVTKVSVGLGGAFQNARLFDWIEGYTNPNGKFGKFRFSLINKDHFTVEVEEATDNRKTFIFKENLKSYSEEEIRDMGSAYLPYLNHGTEGIWETEGGYYKYQIDSEGYPLLFEVGIDARHKETGGILPIKFSATFKK